MVEKGVPELYERDREVMVTTRAGDLKKKVFKDHKYGLKRYTVEEIKKVMEDIVESKKANAEILNYLSPTIKPTGLLEPGMSVEVSDGLTATVQSAE